MVRIAQGKERCDFSSVHELRVAAKRVLYPLLKKDGAVGEGRGILAVVALDAGGTADHRLNLPIAEALGAAEHVAKTAHPRASVTAERNRPDEAAELLRQEVVEAYTRSEYDWFGR